MTTLVVSPHLDDAALSIPGFIHERARHDRVIVLTVFTEGDTSHIVRRAEDLAALALLGAAPRHLGLRDAPQRRGLRPSFRDLILRELPDDDPDAIAVTRTLVAAISPLAPDLLLLPLGVGEHIDHRIVHAAHSQLPGRVGFYEDRPYAHIAHATAARLLRLGATVDGARVTVPDTATAELLAAARLAPHIHAYLPADEREQCLRALAAPLTAPPPPPTLALARQTLRFPAATRERAARAIAAYASQLPDLFGPHAVADGFTEQYTESIFWRP